MDDRQLTELELIISANKATIEETDRMTRQLQELEIESVDAVAIGLISITVLPIALLKRRQA